jgi:hypothetical protein
MMIDPNKCASHVHFRFSPCHAQIHHIQESQSPFSEFHPCSLLCYRNSFYSPRNPLSSTIQASKEASKATHISISPSSTSSLTPASSSTKSPPYLWSQPAASCLQLYACSTRGHRRKFRCTYSLCVCLWLRSV